MAAGVPNAAVTPERVPQRPSRLSGNPIVLMVQLEIPIESVIAGHPHCVGKTCVFMSSWTLRQLPQSSELACSRVDFLMPNENRSGTASRGCRPRRLEQSQARSRFGSHERVPGVAITMGEKGTLLQSQTGNQLGSPRSRSKASIPRRRVTRLQSAGPCVGHKNRLTCSDAVGFATHGNGCQSLHSRHGAQDSIATYEEILKIRENKKT